MRAAGITDGPLFRSVRMTGRVGPALHPQKITEIFRKLATRAAGQKAMAAWTTNPLNSAPLRMSVLANPS